MQIAHLRKDLTLEHKMNSNLNSKKGNNPIRKWAKDTETYFTKEDVWMADKHSKKCSRLLGMKEMQTEATVNYYYALSRTTKI